MATLDRVVLLLAGFDLTCQISADGRQLQIVPIARPVQVTRQYAVSREHTAAFKSLLADDTAAVAAWRGQRVKVAGAVELHERIREAIQADRPAASLPRRSDPRKGASPERRFTLTIVNKPVGAVIDQLAQQLSLHVEWKTPVGAGKAPAREAMVSCDVRQADLDGLLQAVLSPAGLSFEREGSTVTIRRVE
jgi:hypothetical protein